MQSTEMMETLPQHPLAVGANGDIGLHQKRPTRPRLRADLCLHRLEQVRFGRREHNAGTGGRQCQRHGAAQADAGAGHRDNRAVKVDIAHCLIPVME